MDKKIILRLAICSAILFLIGGYLWTIYLSMQSEILELQTEINRLQGTERILENFLEREKNFPALADLSEENFLSAQENLPAESEQEKFTDEIYQSANKNNILVNSMQVGELSPVETSKKNSGEFYRQSVKVQLEANYISLLNFVREILDGNRFATLANISVERDAEILFCDAEFFIYSANLNIQTKE